MGPDERSEHAMQRPCLPTWIVNPHGRILVEVVLANLCHLCNCMGGTAGWKFVARVDVCGARLASASGTDEQDA